MGADLQEEGPRAPGQSTTRLGWLDPAGTKDKVGGLDRVLWGVDISISPAWGKGVGALYHVDFY